MSETEGKTKTTRKMERKQRQTPRQESVYSKLLQGFFQFPCCVLPRSLSWPRQFLPIETIKKNDTRGREIERVNKKGEKHINGAPKDSQLHLFCFPPPHPVVRLAAHHCLVTKTSADLYSITRSFVTCRDPLLIARDTACRITSCLN